MREKISACVIAYNEERKIRRCLQSLAWCDELVVLDSFSTDRTPAICREFTPHVHQHEWLGYVGQRNFVRNLASHNWLLFLDADEEMSPALRDEILEHFEPDAGAYRGYAFPRQVYYLGRWIRHGEWYPDVKLRLFHKAHGRTEGVEPHDKIVVKGPVRRLKNPVWHYTYDDISDHLRTLDRFSTITAQQKFVQDQRFRWTNLLVRPWLRFFKGYVLKLGFLDGVRGLLIAAISAFGVGLKYAKMWELKLKHEEGFKDLPEAKDMRGPGFQ